MIKDKIFTEKYRPKKFEDLILENKQTLIKSLENKNSIPSFIFYSERPGTGKTSCAKIIIEYLDCDFLLINASDERGIDTIREKISLFARTLGMNNIKKCVFLDEADGITRQAQNSMRNLMETYSNNCFFILSANDIAKIIEPIRSRCVIINFENPNKSDVLTRLQYINSEESLNLKNEDLKTLIKNYHPDIRSMLIKLQLHKVDNSPITAKNSEFTEFLEYIKLKDIPQIYEIIYSGTFPIMEFNKWLFHYFFINYEKIGLEKSSKISFLLADTEKYWNQGANLPIIFLSNIIEISKIL